MAGLLAWNQDDGSSILPAQTERGAHRGAAMPCKQRERSSTLRLSTVGRDLGSGWTPKPASGVQFLDGSPTESATEWSVTGPENRGDFTVRGSIPPLSSTETTCMAVFDTRLL